MTLDALDRPATRPLIESDLGQARALSLDAGWPHRIDDWSFVLGIGKAFGAFHANGALVATAMWWPLGDRFAATGMIIVCRTAQRQGLGRKLLSDILAETERRAVTLNATQDGLRLYESVGFRPTRSIHQHQGLVTLNGSFRPPAAETIKPISTADARLVQSLDQAATGLDRGAALRALYPIAEGIILERRGRPVGFSFIRSFGRGLLIGPVVAPDPAGAMALIGHWLAQHAGAFVRVDIPNDDRALGPWLEQWSLAKVDVVTTMWRGTPPPAENGAHVYGLVSQALG